MAGRPDCWRHPEVPGEGSDAPARAVFLVGFMGSGKSSVGHALSRRLEWRFEDLDERIQAREGRSIAEIFRHSGEVGFRQAEHMALQELVEEPPSSPVVVALGGGAFVQADNAALLQAAGALTVFLDAPVDELWRRCQNEDEPDDRPLRRDERQFRQLYEARRPRYMNALLLVDTAGKDVESIAAEIIASLRLQFKLPQKDLGEEK